MTKKVKATDRPSRILGVLIASILMDFIGFGIVIPLLPFYAQSFGASPLEVGVLIGVFPLMCVFAPALWGSLSDRIGRRPALLFNITGTALSYLWLSLANSLTMLLMARVLAGAASASIVIAQSYVSDLTTIENRTKTLSLLEAAAGIGFVIGPVVGGLLVGSNASDPNFRLPGFAATVASGLTFCLAFLALPQSSRNTSITRPPLSPQQFLTEVNKIIKRPLIGTIFALGFITFFAGMGVQAIFALWCEKRFGWGPQQFGYLIIFCCLIVAFIQVGLTGRLARWLGELKLLLCSLVLATFGLALIPFSTTVPQLLGAMLFSIFAQATSPAITSLLSQLSGAKQQGRTLGLMQSVMGLGTFLGSMWAGFIFGKLGENWPYWLSAMLLAMGTVLAWQLLNQSQFSAVMRRRRQQKLMYLFELLDRDKSGTIELKDFQLVGHDLAELRGWQPKTHAYEMLQTSLIGFGKLLQQLADRDGNQQIDQTEWLHCLEKEIDYDFVNLFLEIIDTNQDGQIAMEELKTFYQAYDINTEELEEAFDTLDLNQDGYISQEEFEKIFAQFLYSDDVQAPGNWIFGVSLPKQL